MSAAFLSCKNVSALRYLRQAPAPSRQLRLTCSLRESVSGSALARVCLCTRPVCVPLVRVGGYACASSCVHAHVLPVFIGVHACVCVPVCQAGCGCIGVWFYTCTPLHRARVHSCVPSRMSVDRALVTGMCAWIRVSAHAYIHVCVHAWVHVRVCWHASVWVMHACAYVLKYVSSCSQHTPWMLICKHTCVSH